MSNEASICTMCRDPLHPAAKVCSKCGSTQNPIQHWLFRIGAIAAVMATLVSLVTAAVALWPQAMRSVFPNPKPSLYEFRFDHSDVVRRKLGTFGLLNGGNVDTFVLKISFEASDPLLINVPSRNIIISEWVKQSEAIEKSIGNPDAVRVPPNASRPQPITSVEYSNIRARLIDKGDFDSSCFFLHPYNAFAGIGAPKDGQFRNDEATTISQAMMHYTTVSEREKPQEVAVRNLYIEATLFVKPKCEPVVDAVRDQLD